MKGIYLLYGDEPYLITGYKKQYTGTISIPELNLGIFSCWDDNIISFLKTYPVMDDKKVAIVYIKDLKELNTTSSKESKKTPFEEYFSCPSSTGTLVIIAASVDKRSSIYKMLSKEDGVIVNCNKITDEKMLSKLVLREVGRLNGKITNDAMKLLLEKENYAERDDINLLNIFSDIQRLVSYAPEITVDSVELLIKANLSENVFAIAKMIQCKNMLGLKQQAEVLCSDDDIFKTLGALLREYRIAYKAQFYSSKEIGANYISLKNLPRTELVSGIQIITDSIDGVKNGAIPKQNVLLYTFSKLLSTHTAAIK